MDIVVSQQAEVDPVAEGEALCNRMARSDALVIPSRLDEIRSRCGCRRPAR